MAGDWIKMRSNLRRHPKVVRIASALNADRLRVVGGLHAVWCLFDEHSVDGCLSGYTPTAVDDEVGFAGLATSMIGVGWLAWDGNDGLSLPEFDTHNGASAKRRAQENDRKRQERAASKEDPQDDRSPSASRADKKRTREEKRRDTSPSSEGEGARAKAPARPEDVTEQTWSDWLQLRKHKRAPVTETVIAGARREAVKAGIGLERFLAIWCTRGSQGLQADWLTPDERRAPRQQTTSDRRAETIAGLTNPGEPHGRDDRIVDVDATVVAG